MKKNHIIAGWLLLAVSTFNLQPSTAHAQGTAFTYQGQLNAGGSPANGLYDFSFALYNAASGGAQQGGTVTATSVGVTNGLFTVTLDFGNQFTGSAIWLDISVRTNGASSYAELSPRQSIMPVPYAITSEHLDGALPASQLSGIVALSQLPAAVLTNNEVSVNLTGTFSGNGAGLTSLNASQLSSGTIPLAQLTGITSNQLETATWHQATNLNGGYAALASNVVSGIAITNAFITNSVFAGNGSGLTSLNASQLSSGTIPLAQLTGITSNQLETATWHQATNLNGGYAALASNVVSGIAITNAFITNSVFAGNGAGLTGLNASQLSSGTIPLAQLTGITSNQLETATWHQATNLNGGYAALASNVVSGIAITNAFITNSVFAGNGSGLTSLNASQLSSGTIPLAQLTGITSNQLETATWRQATNLNGGYAALASNVVSGIAITNAFITNSVFAGNGAGLTNIPATALVVAPPGMALIPAGSFTMGNSIGDSDITDANPTNVYVSAFCMDLNLVSWSQWQTVYSYATNQGYTFVNVGAGGGRIIRCRQWTGMTV